MPKDVSLDTMFNGPIGEIHKPINRLMELRMGNRVRNNYQAEGVCVGINESDNQKHFIIDLKDKGIVHVGQGTTVVRMSS